MSPVLRERLRRVRIVRRRVVAISLAIFVLAWAVIFFQMAAGHDPGLVSGAQKRTTTVAATSTQHKSSKKKHTSSTTSAASPSPVTTSQS